MLKEIQLRNYRCFRKASLRLGPLTALVGPNASGKTSLLLAATGTKPRPTDVRHRAPGVTGRLLWSFNDHKASTTFTIGPNGTAGSNQDSGRRPAGQTLHLSVTDLRAPSMVFEQRRLAASGANLVSLIDTLPRRTQQELADRFGELIPVFDDMDVRPKDKGLHRLVFHDRWADVWYEPDEVSDGTLFALALLSLQYQEDVPSVIGIEDPEHGLHPYLMGEIVRILRAITAQGDPTTQIVLATQSAELLDHLEPGEVRFLNRDPEDGSVTIEEPATDTEDWRRAYEEYQRSLGGIWLSGGHGGVPAGG